MPHDELSIIIPTRNEERNLPRLLRSLETNSVDPHRVIVVDGDSKDATPTIAADYGATVILAAPNPSGQRNAGVRAAPTPYALVLDADMELPAGVIDEVVALFDRGERCIILPETSVATSFLSRARGFERLLMEGDLSIEAARAFSTALFAQAGGYDEVVAWGGEEWLLARAMYERCTPARITTKILHHEGDPSVLTIAKKFFVYGRGRYRLFRRNARYFVELTNPVRRSTRRRLLDYARHPVMTAGVIAYKTLTYGAGLAGFVAEAIGMRPRASSAES